MLKSKRCRTSKINRQTAMADEGTKVDPNNPDPGIVPPTLMDAEQQEHLAEMERKAQRISKAALAIEKILLDSNMTWGEWGDIVELFSSRIGHHVSNLPIKLPKK